MRAEQIYEILEKEEKEGSRDGGSMDSFDPDTACDTDEIELKKRLTHVLANASFEVQIKGKGGGSGRDPGGFLERVKVENSRLLNWRAVLRSFFQRMGSIRPDMSRPSRRTLVYRCLGKKLYFPKLRRQTGGTVMVVVDSSGSVDSQSLKMFLGEVASCSRAFRDLRVLLYCCDTQLHFLGEFTGEVPSSVDIKGRGGTSFKPPFDEAERLSAEGRKIQLLIYFTDGECDYPDFGKRPPQYPVLWCMNKLSSEDAPFGTTLRILKN